MIINGPDGIRYNLKGKETHIGRSASNEITRPEDPGLSRHHAVIRLQDGKYVIQDRGSLNGTYVNGRRVRGIVPLQPGDKIEMANTTLLVEDPQPSGTSSLGPDVVTVEQMETTPDADAPDPGPTAPLPAASESRSSERHIITDPDPMKVGIPPIAPARPGAPRLPSAEIETPPFRDDTSQSGSVSEAKSTPKKQPPGKPYSAPVVKHSSSESWFERYAMVLIGIVLGLLSIGASVPGLVFEDNGWICLSVAALLAVSGIVLNVIGIQQRPDSRAMAVVGIIASIVGIITMFVILMIVNLSR